MSTDDGALLLLRNPVDGCDKPQPELLDAFTAFYEAADLPSMPEPTDWDPNNSLAKNQKLHNRNPPPINRRTRRIDALKIPRNTTRNHAQIGSGHRSCVLVGVSALLQPGE